MNDIRSIPNEELVRLGNQGFALALRILGHREDAADAVQDAMHQLFRKHGSFDSRQGSIRGWFLKIVRNRSIDMRRKLRPVSGNESLDPLNTHESSAADIAQQNELVSQVRQALNDMPEETREIIMLRDFHSFSYAEISSVLGIPVGTVMSRLHRARQQLRKEVMNN